MQYWSSYAKGLPAEADEWDISQLLIEGQAVQLDTVNSWISLMNDLADGQLFEQHLKKQKKQLCSSIHGLVQLLAFADAVGTKRRMLLALDAQLSAESLTIHATLGGKELQLVADKCYYLNNHDKGLRQAGAGNQSLVAATGTRRQKNSWQQLCSSLSHFCTSATSCRCPSCRRQCAHA